MVRRLSLTQTEWFLLIFSVATAIGGILWGV